MGRMSPTFATVGVNNVLWLRSLRLPNSDQIRVGQTQQQNIINSNARNCESHAAHARCIHPLFPWSPCIIWQENGGLAGDSVATKKWVATHWPFREISADWANNCACLFLEVVWIMHRLFWFSWWASVSAAPALATAPFADSERVLRI